MNDAQKEFNEKYITAKEIQTELGVCRSSVARANRQGLLPKPIVVGGMTTVVWERVAVRSYLNAWKTILTTRRASRLQQG